MGGQVGVACLLATYDSSLSSNPDIAQKYKMGDISKGVAKPTHYSSPKNYTGNKTDQPPPSQSYC